VSRPLNAIEPLRKPDTIDPDQKFSGQEMHRQKFEKAGSFFGQYRTGETQ
jgi:hypothetical protein